MSSEGDRLPRFLYDQIPSEITNSGALNSKIKSSKDSPYSTAVPSKPPKTQSRTPSSLTLDTSVSRVAAANIPVKVSKDMQSLEVPRTDSTSGNSPLYGNVNEKLSTILSAPDDPDDTEFSFENGHPDQSSLRVSRRISRGFHSNTSSVSWSVNNPEEWTLENVVFWLGSHGFNESWISLFTSERLIKHDFLKLQSYNELKKYVPFLVTDENSTPTRFIQLLRKTLGKNSVSKLEVPSPSISLVSGSSFDSALEDSNPPSKEEQAHQTIGDKLQPVVSAPTLAADDLQNNDMFSGDDGESQRPRPVSTIEPSTTQLYPSSPSFHSKAFFKRHQKSSSSESSFLSPVFGSNSAGVPPTPSAQQLNTPVVESFQKRHERTGSKGSISDSNTPKNIFNKFFGKSKADYAFPKKGSPVGPSSANGTFKKPLDRKVAHEKSFTVSKNKPSDPKFEKLGPVGKKPSPIGVTIPVVTKSTLHSKESFSSSTSTLALPTKSSFVLDHKFRPVPRNNRDVFVLASRDNVTFTRVDVMNCSHVDEFKRVVADALNIKFLFKAEFALTGFNSDPGQPLDDETIDELMKRKFFGETMKILVTQKGLERYASTLSAYSSHSLTSDNSLDRINETPQYLLEATKNGGVDYVNFKEYMHQENNKVAFAEPKRSTSSSLTRARSITTTSNPDSATFRVIRPEKREIDFDKKRESPFVRRDSLVARRIAPAPPVQESSPSSATSAASAKYRKPPPPLPETQGEKNTIIRAKTIKRSGTQKTLFDPFKENTVSFENAPELEESDDSSSLDSDDGLFAKAPSKNSSQSLKMPTNISSSSTDSLLEIRPPPEVLYDNLEIYFPNTDLDKLIIDEVVSPPVSPVAEEKVAPKPDYSDYLKAPEPSGKIHRMKSIRIVAQEAKKEAQKKLGNHRPSGNLLRRTSTKMWGQKVVEVTPGNRASYVNKLKNHKGQYKEFAWVKGELIGVGTFGKVYLALNVTTGEMIAVKQTVISSKFRSSRETKEIMDTFRAEVDSLKDLDHVNIVQYLGFEKKDNVYSLFLEYVSGGSVGHLIRRYGRFSEDLIKFLTEQVLQGLQYIHSKGILHRDLKADNLLLEMDGICKISDFGISKKAKDIYTNESAMSFQGTIFWMAPEIIDNTQHKGYSAKVDIWSLGCVVLEMYAGQRPWSDFAIAGAIFKLGNKSAPPVPEETRKMMSDTGSSFLDRCFETDPEQRPTATELLKHEFCEKDETFVFANTELARKMKHEDTKEEKKADMMMQSKAV
ncbi:hypothetical protein KL935_003672 [Ogataea polymorpha]|uniref:Protein kinase domain-containing protein n=2 Tax=Ogataea polymorpha TaxID=460523 RepID=A0A9P8NUR7_9ASCO|nr:hypothetical protein KL908_003711 [Ogataea polymorpha]KAG7899362.1 hypothetical protein KL935_003672 [Ogataea polymorpha]KAG7907645.1 hypothetical protein KL906_003726 [Ogataea polymorpha]KAG7915577.1 hypothetical protein KL927_003853 [Ogataea polymorpha]KAG7932855.1 hypothetical protein KL934_003510 [Ogataea polymorpha]